MGLEEISRFRQCIFACSLLSPLGKGRGIVSDKLESPSPYLWKSSITICTILERDMMSIFLSKCGKNVRIQALSASVKFGRRLMQKILDLLSCDLTISKDQRYRAEAE